MKTVYLLPCAAIAILAGDYAGAQARLEEITVTAQRREESLQDASVAIDVVSNESIIERGMFTAESLAQLVPALQVTNGGGVSGAIFMRGVGNRAQNNFIDPAITVNYDGVPMARGSAVSTGQFFDLERIEVLKGPQGTLYGRNATGGVVNLIPAKPQLGETNGYVNASFGNYDEFQVQGAVNVPLGDNSAFRLAGMSLTRDGYNDDGTADADRLSLRGQYLVDVSDALDLRLAVDYTDVGGVGNGTTPVGRYQGAGLGNYNFIPSGIDADEGTNTPTGNAFRQSTLSAPGFGFLSPVQDEWFTEAEYLGFNAEVNYTTDAGTLTFIPAWRSTESESFFNGPGFNSGWWNNEVDQTSFELRWSSDAGDGFVDYVVGAYYFDESMEGNNTFNQEFVLPLQDYTMDAESWAVFGQLTWNFTDATRLVTGIRYTDDSKDMDGAINNFITFCGGLGPAFVTPPGSFAQGCATPGNLPRYPTLDTPEQAYDFLFDNGWASTAIPIPPGFLIPLNNGVGQILNSVEEHVVSFYQQEPTYRIALEWDGSENSMLYASIETGYRSGGPMPNFDTPYRSEFIDAYTVGAKNTLADGRVQLNVEVFRWEYEDQQINYFTLTDAGVLVSLTDNVGQSTNQGFDVQLLWLATDNTLITSQVQYLDATYDDLIFSAGPPRDNINCPFQIIGTQGNGAPAMEFDCSGNDSIYSPEWTVQLGIEHTIPLGNYNLIGSIFTQYVDDQVTAFNNLPHEFIEEHTRTDIDVTLVSADETWSLSAFARNLEDERRVVSTQAPLLGMAMVSHGIPLTYGVRFNYNF